MPMQIRLDRPIPFQLLLFVLLLGLGSCAEEQVDFNAEIRPILNEHCVSCHGGVKRSGGFGLVFRENALKETENGKLGIVPGQAQKSEMYSRLIHSDPEMRMPLEKAPLKKEEIKLIKRWIDQGANWEEHWAYLPPQKPSPPQLASNWPQGDIDRFILKKIQEEGLQPSPKAERATLARRLFLDLTGLPPSPEQLQLFLQDSSTNAYENLVDSLLASPFYGEHWASMWLDLARYADSFGYSSDLNRVIWKYRDWVIQALNKDLPFDQFTIEQLAGDLLPNPSIDQLVATAFHRNSMTNGEGGAYHEEFRNAAVIDRINTTWETWQATTMGCVQCHNHPYDPIKQTEFYGSFAFFNNTNDRNLIAEYPVLKTLEEVDQKQLEGIKEWITKYGSVQQAQQLERLVLTQEPKIIPTDFNETHKVKFLNRIGDDYMSVYDSSFIKIAGIELEAIDKIYLHYLQYSQVEGKLLIRLDSPEGPIIGESKLQKTTGLDIVPVTIKTSAAAADLYFTFQCPEEGFEGRLDGIILGNRLPGEEETGFAAAQNTFDNLMQAPPKVTTPIMVEKPASLHRTTQLFERGNWLQKGEIVEAGIPKLFNKNNATYTNRLDLAQWLVSEENPLTARVIVNRIWASIFGKGIVQTLEDFGTMGDLPSHPELLDYLALHFSGEQRWQFKKLIKSIVMSATYQQSSKMDATILEKDPNNLYLARSPRKRLSAEQVRDQALFVSGLLSHKMYGPSVMPVQPDGIWQVSFSNAAWKTSEGEDRYRRAIYTFIKRSAPYPSFITFDAAGREVCLSRRITTNTPLQALVTLNDPVFFEAARALAHKVSAIDGPVSNRLSEAYLLIMGKKPSAQKADVLQQLYQETKQYFEENKEEAFEIAASQNIDLAVFTIVANSLMNMDEFIVKG